MADDGVAIDLRDVTVGYGDATPVLRDVTLHVPAGTTTVLLGPSGCGKTTLLRSIAGLERPSGGTICIGDVEVSGPRTWVPPERRRVGMVFQDAALFPHLSVADNVAFGLRSISDASARRRRIADMLDLVGLGDFADRRPGTLSGGQRQRVALARSLAPHPAVLLLDEPFSALDAALRGQLRTEVGAIIREVGVTAVFVTHDQAEAFVVGDHIGVVHAGALRQLGTAEALYRTPVDAWVATFVGEANVVSGSAADGVVHTSVGDLAVSDRSLSGAVDVLVRPEDLLIGAAHHSTAGFRVVSVAYLGADAVVELVDGQGSRWRARTSPVAAPGVGTTVGLRHAGTATVAWPR